MTTHDFLAVQAAFGQFPGWEVGWSGRQFQRMILKAVMNATAIACVSESTRQAIRIFMTDYAGEVRTIMNSTYRDYQRIPSDQALARLNPIDRPKSEKFFFHIGGNKPYKNRSGALSIYKKILELDPNCSWGLVMAGGSRTDELELIESKLGIRERTQWIVEPKDPQVEALYSLASALLFPSLAEGFGLPILEAQACGCPVFASNRGPMTEVGGGSAVYFDPSDPQDAATQVLSQLDNLPELVRLGKENLTRFHPTQMADSYWKYYNEIVG